jgi:hypothetical protein
LFSTIKETAELTSYLATIMAAGFAVAAISAWKKQFNHQQRFESLRTLKLTTRKLFIGRDLLRSFRTRELSKHASESEKLTDEKRASHRKQIKNWVDAYSEFIDALEEATLFFNSPELDHLWNAANDQANSLNEGINELSEIINSNQDRPALETFRHCQKWELNFDQAIEEIYHLIRTARISAIR